ncbi:MAG: PD-(D/E)XK nuclease family protein, partial [Candidatus Omnitrophota bacterium]
VYEPLIPREVMLSLGLNRLEKEEEIQRYQFRRLIAGAKNVHLVYAENEISEKSRFIEELLWQRQKRVNKLEVASVPRASFVLGGSSKPETIKKTPEIIKRLQGATYSASRLNTYLNCPLQFYYQYVLGLKEKEDLLEGPQAWQIGTFIHELLENGFNKFLGKRPVIDAEFKKHFFKLMEEKFEKEIKQRMKSDSFLLKGIISARLNKFLEKEIERNVEKIISLEEKIRAEMISNVGLIKFIYMVDRIDEFNDKSIVIIDYKTGGSSFVPKRLKNLESLEMNRRSIKDNIRSFQLPLYYYFTKEKWPKSTINAELYNIRTLERNPFISKEDKGSEDKIMEICIKALEFILREIFNSEVAFEADREERKCQACPFRGLCK